MGLNAAKCGLEEEEEEEFAVILRFAAGGEYFILLCWHFVTFVLLQRKKSMTGIGNSVEAGLRCAGK
jgi:hypothetical protein